MKKNFVLFSVVFIGLLYIFSSGTGKKMQEIKGPVLEIKTSGIQPGAAVKPDLNFGKFPLYFIYNKGQVDKQAAFYAKASRYTLWLTKQGLVFDAHSAESIAHSEKVKAHKRLPHSPYSPHSPHSPKTLRDVSRLIFLDSNKNPEMVPIKETQLRVNYFKGNDKSKWHCDIPTSQAVLYKNLYKNIDLKVYGIEKQIEYDWIVKPGGNPGDIRFEYKSVKGTRIDNEGNLMIETDFGELMHKCPVSYQRISREKGAWSREKGEGRRDVDVQFIKIGKNTYGFKVGEYNKSCDLIIDPVVLAYSTYLGGGSDDVGSGIAVDSSGYAYVTGRTMSTDFPTLNQYQADQPDLDVFVTKLDTTQSGAASLIYSTYLGGSSNEGSYGIAVDSSGYAYVTGTTYSTNFPTLNQYQVDQPNLDVFVTKLDTTQGGAASLIYSTYLGGESFEQGYGIAVDNSGYVYVTGYTLSTDFPTLNQYQTNPRDDSYDVFVTKLDTTQSGAASLIYSTYLGGDGSDYGESIAVDSSGYAYVTGRTMSTDFPTLNQYQADQPDLDVFVTKLDTTQSGAASLIYSTYLGGNWHDNGKGIAVDNSGYTYVTGDTDSADFPTLNQYQADPGDDYYDVFVTKLDTTHSGTSSLLYSTYLGGEDRDQGYGIAADSSGHAYVTGRTKSTDFPILKQYQAYQGIDDAFVTKLDTTQSGAASLIYSTYLGGSSNEGSYCGIAVGSSGYAYVIGFTMSTDFPTLNQYQTDQGDSDVFVTKLILPNITVLSPNGSETWKSGSNRSITWDTQGVSGSLKIYLWKDDSLIGTVAKNLDPVTGLYLWTVGEYEGGTAALGTGYTIKIKEMGVHLSDFSDAPFIICSLTVLSPNGGENWKSGSAQNITWNAPEVSGNLRITLWKDGSLVKTIAKDIDPASGSYPWIVGQHEGGKAVVGTGYTIKVKEMGNPVSDFSDAPFNITGITVTAPNGGESWQIGSFENITWNTQEVSGDLKIFLYKDGALVGTIAKNLDPAAGYYAWTVGQYEGGTASAGTGYTIKIKEMGVTVADFSDNPFALSN